MNSLPAPYWLLAEDKDQLTSFVIVTSSLSIDKSLFLMLEQVREKYSITLLPPIAGPEQSPKEITLNLSTQNAWKLFQELLEKFKNTVEDIALLPASSRQKKLLICDMDSTIVASESLDDLAELVGIAPRIKEITRRAMAGELDFTDAFQQRIKLLENTPVKEIDKILSKIQLTPGASNLLKIAKLNGMRTILVSGGVKPIVQPIADQLGFDRCVSNKIEFIDGGLSSQIFPPIINDAEKLKVLHEECKQMGILPEDACSLGDGANDILMIKDAGLGIAYRGKDILKASTPYQINTADIDFALKIMGMDDQTG